MNFFESLMDIPNRIAEFVLEIMDMIASVISSLYDFYYLLQDFDDRIVAMTNSCGSSEFTGMPIVDAIGTFRYMVGDVAFMMIYFSILFGCLLTIYKLVVLLIEALKELKTTSTGGVSSGRLAGMLRGIFR